MISNMSKKVTWPATLAATAAISLFGVVGTSTAASAEETGPAANEQGVERPDPETLPFIGWRLAHRSDSIYVRDVLPDGPADVAGVGQGDQVLSINGVALDDRGAMREAMGSVEPGDTITVVVVQGDVEKSVRIVTGTHEDRPDPEDRPYLGAQPERPQDKDQDGIEIGNVNDGSPADLAGLAEGDVILSVNGVDVTTPREAFDRLRELSPGDTLFLSVLRDGEAITLSVVLGSQAENPNAGERPDRPKRGGDRGGDGPRFRGVDAEESQPA